MVFFGLTDPFLSRDIVASGTARFDHGAMISRGDKSKILDSAAPRLVTRATAPGFLRPSSFQPVE